jgi:transcription elongation factor GreA
MALEETYLTTDGLHQLEEELENLRTVRRQGVADRIQQAKEVGGTVDNAEYEEAKNELAYVEGRVQTLEAMIHNAVIIPDHHRESSDVVELGSIVKVEVEASKGSRTYTIVGSTEAAPESGRISNESPVGKALLGKRAGDTVEIAVPSGTQRIKLIKVQ